MFNKKMVGLKLAVAFPSRRISRVFRICGRASILWICAC
ncbi:hypothetical protein CEV32_1681 [Brucella rhizosphaerae]|uniref:Uncharacterized protein n=1 Tax=Brucella rhizosphaerae TaxID=571254 RepID=A0A256F969_9HYPH|nr:hypothetical protein CEV32_1681 [Brucella rhizosphaerae]